MRQRGFALVSTLLIVVLVAIIAVSFLAAVGTERVTTGAYTNMQHARLAATAAMESGLARMATLLEHHPGAATIWEERGGVVATVLYFPIEDEEGEATTQVAPLLSGVEESSAGKWRGGEPAMQLAYPEKPFEDAANSVDINLPRHAAELAGWIGSPAGETRREMRVPWVELRTPEGELTGRYAYWIEDESFKVALNHTQNGERGSATPGVAPEEIPLQGVLAAVAARLESGSEDKVDEVAHQIAALRNTMPGERLRDWNALNSLSSLAAPGAAGLQLLGEQLKYYGTLFSESANLTAAGARRLDLNALFTPVEEAEAARQQVERAVAAIRHNLPSFGERFYSGAALNQEHQRLYLEKLAANIRDAMMPQGTPLTILWEEGEAPPAGRPAKGVVPMGGGEAGPNPARAVGKKNIPYLQEWACHVRLLKFDETKGSHADFEFIPHFYLELWNMSPIDIDTERGDLGENPFIRLYNLPTFDTGSTGPIGFEGNAIEIPLKNVVFKAGRATVVTTALPGELNLTLLASTPGDSLFFTPPALEKRSLSGRTDVAISSGRFRLNFNPRSTTATDYETCYLLGNDAGLLDSVAGLPLARGAAGSSGNALSLFNDKKGDVRDDTIDGDNVEQFYVRGGSLHGNLTLAPAFKAAQTGDPRSSNEQLVLRLYDKAGDDEQTRYYNSGLDNPSSKGNHVPAQSSLGRENAGFIEPTHWPDPFSWSSDGVNSPVWLPSGPFHSIGELGHVYDPARAVGPSGSIFHSRGGGRTLAIGQPDALDNRGDGADSTKAWRLVDLFSTTSELLLPGRININGILRDDGVAFCSLFSGYRYAEGEAGDPGLAGEALAPARLEAIVSAMKKHLEERGPYFERGAYSEALGGEDNAAYDRGREELFRRSVELTTTRGSLFTLYAIGEAVRETPSGGLARGAVARLKITFKVVPVWSEPLEEAFDPTNTAAVEARFRPPDRYAVEIVQVE